MARLLTFALATLVLASCKTTSKASGALSRTSPVCKASPAKRSKLHDFNAWSSVPTGAALWLDDTPERLAQTMNMLKGAQQYPDDHDRTKRMQEWLSAFHRIVKSMNPDLDAPEPKALLIKQNDIQAMVPSVDICVDIAVKFRGAKHITDQQPQTLILRNQDDKYVILPPSNCVKRDLSRDQLNDVLNYFLGDSTKCVVAFPGANGTKNLELSMDLNCLQKSNAFPAYAYEKIITQLSYKAISNRIVMTDKLFEISEPSVAFILAHELGHYYHLHSSAGEQRYNYFYQLDRKNNVAARPRPLPETHPLAELGKKIRKLKHITVTDQYAGQFHPRLFQLITSWEWLPKYWCTETRCEEACAALDGVTQRLSNMDNRNKIYPFPYAPLPTTMVARTLYKEFEDALTTCSQQVDLDIRTLRYRDHQLGLDKGTFEAILGDAKTLADLLPKLNPMWPDAIKKSNQLSDEAYKTAQSERLGYYTDEQEADEVALELGAHVGVNVNDAMEMFFFSLKQWNDPNPTALNAAQCQSAHKNNFRDFIPIGDYQDPHHDTCYRAYNVFRESVAHKDELAEVPRDPCIAPDEQLWKRLQSQSL
ncbi:MAG: hypothetical protein FJ146_06250 [Deltaproteobacteria bacterium]|nr:hypothetical protein [Deltaproteobacteria bacterium]